MSQLRRASLGRYARSARAATDSALEWTESAGTGEVYSWIVTHQPYGPDLAELVPYPVALVRLDEQDDIMIPGRYVGVADLAQGLRVRVRTEVATEDIGLLTWAPMTEGPDLPADHPGFVWVLDCPCGERLRGDSEDHIVEVALATSASGIPIRVTSGSTSCSWLPSSAAEHATPRARPALLGR